MGNHALALKKHETTKIYGSRQYWGLAFPLIIAGISTPIIGAVDTAVVGRLPEPSAIGGVAIGAVIFNTMYWLFGFLRVSTSGFTAQAQGARNDKEEILCLVRPILIAVLLGVLFIIFQRQLLTIALHIFGGSAAVSTLAASYFSIRIWGAPFILISYCLVGWLIGMGKVRLSLATQLIMNLLNILLSILFVLGLNLGVEGVAYATLIAEISAVLFGGIVVFFLNKSKLSLLTVQETIRWKAIKNMLSVNRDLFLRTICLLIMTGIFTSKGAALGDVTLAANAILLQIHYIMAYLVGGFANASSILSGRAIGGGDSLLFKRMLTLSVIWGAITAVSLALSMIIFGETLISIFTNMDDVKQLALQHMWWMVIFPIVGFWGLMLEGVFSGATDATSIRNSIFFALVLFLVAIWMAVPTFQNQGLWLAFVLFSLSRSLFLWMYIPGLVRRISL
ncbi:DNA-damage-inducible protein F [Bacillus sp. THAF10]|uniref:MATE family efflux transporter n=1 Tax=Bacillus sp. THAF10 TaxID=2587848 RepID=UPI001267A43B|nr:MATE family efflux transporter [Bacillus sp. THAF10]QFT89573.1 DNA-damage-inducible protein F [Bacillus sp. THAF10]